MNMLPKHPSHTTQLLLLLLLLILMLFSFLASLSATPATWSLSPRSNHEEGSSLQESLGAVDWVLDAREGDEASFINRRMDLESTDYPGTGANNRHDPRTPGTA